MPEAAVAPSAPAAPAPASSGGGGGPSWAGGSIGDFISGVTAAPTAAPAPAPTPAPVVAAPAPVAAPTPAPVEVPAAAAPAPAPVVEPAQPVAPAKPEAAAPVAPPPAPRLFAGRFKTDVELERAYEASGIEARRLNEVATAAQKQVDQLKADLDAIKLEKELGPEIKDLTPEEEAAMTPAQLVKHSASKMERNWTKQKLEAQAKQKAEADKQSVERIKTSHLTNLDLMAKDSVNFPRLEELAPVIHQVMDWAPELGKNPDMPKIAYLVAYGHEAMQRDRASASESAKSTEAARIKAQASLAAAAGGGGQGQPEPTPPQSAAGAPAPGSDAEHNNLLVAAWGKSKSILPSD